MDTKVISINVRTALAELRKALCGDFVNTVQGLDVQLYNLNNERRTAKRALIIENIRTQSCQKFFERYPEKKYLYPLLLEQEKAKLAALDALIDMINSFRTDPVRFLEKTLDRIERFYLILKRPKTRSLTLAK